MTNTGSSALQPVKINEWMASNNGPDGYPDPADGLFQDWIELYNPNTAAVDLSGYRLTDDLASPAKWTIPAGTSIAPLGYLVIWADNDILQNTPGNGLHAAFQLSGNGETLGLFNPAGVLQHTIAFGPQNANISEGLFPDGSITGVQPMPNWTPRYPNTLAAPMKITEISHANGTISLKWTTLPGRSYRVESNQDLSPAWNPLGPDVPGNGEPATFTDPAASTFRRFYRVRRLE